MTIDEMIAVLQAAKEGKTIQYRTVGGSMWADICSPCWDFAHSDYRVKPEPRRWWMCVNDTTNAYTSHNSREMAERDALAMNTTGPASAYRWRVVEVVEVL